ncbi:MAG TPA: hypothetical protein VGI82_04360 [Chitinophagaceae bacterium]
MWLGSTDDAGIKHETPGITGGFINAFTTNIGVTMDGIKVPMNDFKNTAQHEAGHSGKLAHPWELSKEEKNLVPDLNQLDPAAANKKTILKNIMNSYENPDAKYRSNGGNILLFNQLRYIINQVRDRARYTPEQLRSSNPEEQRNKDNGNN